jgi:tripartite ATP-independent transporter DctM subunit
MLVPKMLERKYSPVLAIGPSFAAGGLALIIPPSGVTIVLGAVTGISIAKLLIAGLIPGLILALFYCVFAVTAAWIDPSLAPVGREVGGVEWRERWYLAATILPFGLIIFSVVGLLFLGIAGPSEAAAFGAISAFVLAILYRRMNMKVFREAIFETIQISVMLYTIVMGAKLFSQVIAFSGIASGLSQALVRSEMSPILFFLLSQAVIFILGLFMEITTIIFITMPLFMPVVDSLGIHPVHFGIVSLVSLELATYTPPFGLVLYASHSVLSEHVSVNTMFKIAIPWIIIELAGILLFLFVPETVLWLPNLMLR